MSTLPIISLRIYTSSHVEKSCERIRGTKEGEEEEEEEGGRGRRVTYKIQYGELSPAGQ